MHAADHVLLNRWIAERDAQAFKALTLRYCAMVHSTSVRILRNSSDAEEITQECFAALASAAKAPQGSMGAWLHRMATYQALNRRRSDGRRRAREEQFAHTRAAPAVIQWDDLSQFIDQSIEALPTKIRVAMVAHFLEDQPVTAIAARESVTHGAISQRIQKGIVLIRERMVQNGIPVAAAALATMLAQNASATTAIPATLSANLGKLAISGRGCTTAVKAAPSMLRTKVVLAAAAGLAVVAASLVYVATPGGPPATAAERVSRTGPVTAVPAAQAAPADENVPVPVAAEPQPMAAYAAPARVAAAPLAATPAAAAEPTTWREVVDAYAAHQDRIRRIRFDYEHASKGDYFFQTYAPEPGYREFFERGSLVTDGERCAMKQLRWGHNFADGDVPPDRPSFGTFAYNGDTYANYIGGGGAFYGRPGMVQFTPNARNSKIRDSAFRNGRCYLLFSRYPEGAMLGLPLDEGWHMEELLYDAHQVALRADKEDVGDSECYVVDAASDYGYITVWFDPSRDFNVAKSIIRQGPGQIHETSPLPDGTYCEYTYTVLRFAKVDGRWLPVESTSRQLAMLLKGNGHDYTHHHKRSNIKLLTKGEDDDVYAIYADDIPNGATLQEMGVRRPHEPEWHWYNGQFLLMADNGESAQHRSIQAPGFGGGAIVGGAE